MPVSTIRLLNSSRSVLLIDLIAARTDVSQVKPTMYVSWDHVLRRTTTSSQSANSTGDRSQGVVKSANAQHQHRTAANKSGKFFLMDFISFDF